MEGKAKKYILSVLYDVRPVDKSGNLDVEKIRKIKEVLDLKKDYQFVNYQPSKNILTIQSKRDQEQSKIKLVAKKKTKTNFSKPRNPLPNKDEILKELEDFNKLDTLLAATNQSVFEDFDFIEKSQPKIKTSVLKKSKKIKNKKKKRIKSNSPKKEVSFIQKKQEQDKPVIWPGDKEINQDKINQEDLFKIEEFYFPEAADSETNILETRLASEKKVLSQPKKNLPRIDWSKPISFLKPGKIPQPKSFLGFILTGFLIALVIPLTGWLGQGMLVKERVMSNSLSAYQNLLEAKDSLENVDWQKAEQNFAFAHNNFNQAYSEAKELGGLVLNILEGLPGDNKVSSGTHLIKVGEHLTSVGQTLVSAINDLSLLNFFNLTDLPIDAELTDYSSDLPVSDDACLTDSIFQSKQKLTQSLNKVRLAIQESKKVEVSVLPEDIQEKAALLKKELPDLKKMLLQAIDFSSALLEILGHDNPRQYLLVFQNNSEIRATGGFIGTYGLIQFDQGKMKRLLVDGVFNPDGQLHEKIIPPQPIQKISTAWSMHDANWFPDFPSSAKKIQWFYEKAGGVTTDGVWAFTPVIVERLLELTGPIHMPEYGIELNSQNFVEIMQYKVEVDYDKRLNRPKKILADFTPLFLNALSDLSLNDKTKAIQIIFNALKEKHLLFYFNDSELEDLIIDQGWSGELKTTEHDYLSVVSSNINGYKTDRMIDESISLTSQIETDGSILNTLTITRQHLGGNEEYDWWNQVNSNYLRVYVPEGSELVSARGQTIEPYNPPIDYQENGFQEDPLVAQIEREMEIDDKTGTYIFKENNKTVFGNWVYVSPGRKAVVTYKYRLPFKIDLTESSNNYSILIQKQAGSLGSDFSYQLDYLDEFKTAWIYPEDARNEAGQFIYQSDLKVDQFLGITFEN